MKHVCPRWLYVETNAEFCQTCKVNTILCDSPSSHAVTAIPQTFNGAGLGSPAVAAPQGMAATAPGESQSQGGNSRGPDDFQSPPPDHQLNVAILAMQAGESPPAENWGQLGHPAPLTSKITLKKDGQTMLVPCLFDSGSESSYFHPDLERMETSRRRKRFQLETLSMSGKTEEVDGLLVTFEAIMAKGQVVNLEALLHHGLGKSGTMLRSKVLSVPVEFANHWNLKNLEVVKTDPMTQQRSLHQATTTHAVSDWPGLVSLLPSNARHLQG